MVTVSDEGLFLKKVTSGKGYVLQSEEEIVLRREESKSLALSSHSCQGIAGALGSGLRHYLREGQVDKELGKAAVKGGAYSWGMSIVTQSIERRHAGGGAAAFAFVQAAQQSLAALRDPTKTNKEKVGRCRDLRRKSLGGVWGTSIGFQTDDGVCGELDCASGGNCFRRRAHHCELL